MQLFERAFEKRDATFALKDPAIQALRDAFGIGDVAAGVSVSERTAEGLPVVWRCVTIVSDTIAFAPIKIMRLLPRGKEPDPNHPLYVLLHDLPNPMMTAHAWKSTMQRALCLWGNAYSLIERKPNGEIKALWPLHPSRMRVEWEGGGGLTYIYRRGNGSEQRWEFDAQRPPIFHLSVYSEDGIHGRSPIRLLRESVGEAQAAREFAASFWARGATLDGFIQYPTALKPVAKQNLADSIRDRWAGGLKTAHHVGILEEGAKFQPVSMPLEDAQFLQSRQFQSGELSLLYGVPPFLLNQTEKSTSWGTGLEQQSRGFATWTMNPWFSLWAQAVGLYLLTSKSFETHEAKFVKEAIVSADLQTRTEAYERQIKVGMMSPNEAREREDMNPRKDGDDYVDVTAVGSGGNINRQPKAPPEPEPATPEPDEAAQEE